MVSDSRKAWWPTFVMLCASDATVEVAKVALAEALHERVFLLPFSKDASENLNDYDSPLSFLDSIHTEHVKSKLPNSYTASEVWSDLHATLKTLRVNTSEGTKSSTSTSCAA